MPPGCPTAALPTSLIDSGPSRERLREAEEVAWGGHPLPQEALVVYRRCVDPMPYAVASYLVTTLPGRVAKKCAVASLFARYAHAVDNGMA